MPPTVLLGPPALVDSCAPAACGALEPLRLPSETPEAARAAEPDAVVAFSPSAADRALVDELDLPTLLWWPDEIHGPAEALKPNQRLIAGSPRDERAWRSVPLPVGDHLYAEPVGDGPARAAWLGPSTARRDAYLKYFEHADMVEDGPEAAVAVNLHDDDRPACEHRALRALAQGRLLVSEPLTPSRGLEPGIDYLQALDFDDLFLSIEAALRAPSSFRRVQLRGRRKAELFRSSRVISRLVGDLLLELG